MGNQRIYLGEHRDIGFCGAGKYRKLLGMGLIIGATVLAANRNAKAQNTLAGPAEGWHPDPAKELPLKITDPFTITTVGDIIEPQPISNRIDPGFQSLVKIVHDADLGVANMETSLVDMHHRDEFLGPLSGTLAPKEVGADIKSMGFMLVNRANNHALDGDVAGMISTDEALDELGIVHAGSGKNLNVARAASFIDTTKGRVGLVGAFSIDTSTYTENGAQYVSMAATYRIGDMGGRPGINPLRLTTYHVVTPEQLQSLRAVRDAYQPVAANAPKDRLQIFDDYYKTGDQPGSMSYEMNPDDEKEFLRSIRNGKYSADFMIATVHAHHGAQDLNGVRFVSDFLLKIAHESIDNGADMFVVHGPHELLGVEIYKGKPIFYGIASFIIQSDIQISGSPKDVLSAPADERPNCCVLGNSPGQDSSPAQEGMMTETRFEGGKLVEVRLHPIDLGVGDKRPMSRQGIPAIPSPELAKRMLEEMQNLSKPFGTKIEIKDGVGIIHVALSTADRGK